jgi:hypothetical protein
MLAQDLLTATGLVSVSLQSSHDLTIPPISGVPLARNSTGRQRRQRCPSRNSVFRQYHVVQMICQLCVLIANTPPPDILACTLNMVRCDFIHRSSRRNNEETTVLYSSSRGGECYGKCTQGHELCLIPAHNSCRLLILGFHVNYVLGLLHHVYYTQRNNAWPELTPSTVCSSGIGTVKMCLASEGRFIAFLGCPYSGALLEKLIVSQLVKTFFALYGIWSFITKSPPQVPTLSHSDA